MSSLWLVLFLFVAACSEDGGNGLLQVQLIQPEPQHCQYNIAPEPIQTLRSISKMEGSMGKVVYNSQNVGVTPAILDEGFGFKPLDLQFAHWGNTYDPLDLTSLYAASLYYAMEAGYLLFRDLDPMRADMAHLVPDLASTTMVYNARRTFGDIGEQPEVQDNAEYYADRVKKPDGTYLIRDYFFSYPTKKVSQVPLGLNLGIMVHEYTHFVFHYLFYEPWFSTNTDPSNGMAGLRTLRAFDEGNADYFGFLAAKDPGYFLCSYPTQPRDLSVYKPITAEMAETIQTGVDFLNHDVGASWASIQFKIGSLVGFRQNGQALIQLMATLLTGCGNSASGLIIDFPTLASCHMQYLGELTDSGLLAQVQQIYNDGMAGFGGGI